MIFHTSSLSLEPEIRLLMNQSFAYNRQRSGLARTEFYSVSAPSNNGYAWNDYEWAGPDNNVNCWATCDKCKAKN